MNFKGVQKSIEDHLRLNDLDGAIRRLHHAMTTEDFDEDDFVQFFRGIVDDRVMSAVKQFELESRI